VLAFPCAARLPAELLDDVGVVFAPQQHDGRLITAGAGSEKAGPFARRVRRFYGLDAGG
jgi:hypothetical protein